MATKGIDCKDWTIPNTELASDSFDLIIAATLVERIPTWITVFELSLEYRRLRKPGGSILIISPNGPGNGRVFWEDYKHGWFDRTPDAFGLSGFVRKTHKTMFQQVIVIVTKDEILGTR